MTGEASLGVPFTRLDATLVAEDAAHAAKSASSELGLVEMLVDDVAAAAGDAAAWGEGAAEDFGGGSGGAASDYGVFKLVYDETGEFAGFANTFFQVGGFTLVATKGADLPAEGLNGRVAALVISASQGTTPSGTVEFYASLADMQAAQSDLDTVIVPLYKFDSYGGVEVDFRRMPTSGMLEYFPSSSSSGGSSS